MARAKKKANAETSERISPWFLEHVKLTSFGRFANVFVGTLGPGLNVVLGPNEAGKTTLSELIKGIIFGWPAARGGANPYRPQNAERSGSLFFRNESTDDVQELTRVRNPDGIDDESGVTADIDRETYDVMFALTSDELLGLDRHN